MNSKFKSISSIAFFLIILLIASLSFPTITQPISAAPDEFTIIALPDTQKYSQSYPHIYMSQTQWIIDNKDSLNIVFVLHEGDIVQNWNSITEWDRADSSMSLLDDNVPYSVVPGNHDHEGASTSGSTSYYNTYFPVSRFNSESWWGGNFHDNDNNYQLLTIGEDDYIFLNIDYCPSSDELAWADSVLDSYPNRKAILTTHRYLEGDGSRNGCGNSIWTNLVNGHSNLQIVLCGHVHTEARRVDNNQAGKPVYQMLADYQDRTNGGNSWLRILTFVPLEDKIYVKTYSPYLDQYETDHDSEFTLDYEMTSNANNTYPICNMAPDIVDSDENKVYFIYPDYQGSKPPGVAYALLTDWTAAGYIAGMCTNSQNEATDTNQLIIDNTNGKVLLNNKLIILFGGPLVTAPIKYYESNRIAPLYYQRDNGVSYWHLRDGTRIEETGMTPNSHSNMFMIESFIDDNGNKVLIVCGYGWKGTYAGGKFFKFVIDPNRINYDNSYYIFRWDDDNGDYFVDLNEISTIAIATG